MLKKLTIAFAASAAALLAATTSGMAQTKLKWAHVYETSEPFHTASVWAAGEIGKRTKTFVPSAPVANKPGAGPVAPGSTAAAVPAAGPDVEAIKVTD